MAVLSSAVARIASISGTRGRQSVNSPFCIKRTSLRGSEHGASYVILCKAICLALLYKLNIVSANPNLPFIALRY
jgi:hypothetical protein